jgi:hypothetical protein
MPREKVERLKWCRNKVLELSREGHSQPEISRILRVNLGIVNNDLSYLRQQAQESINTHLQQKLPEEYQNCITGMNQVLRLSWQIANSANQNNDLNDSNGQNSLTQTDNKNKTTSIISVVYISAQDPHSPIISLLNELCP